MLFKRFPLCQQNLCVDSVINFILSYGLISYIYCFIIGLNCCIIFMSALGSKLAFFNWYKSEVYSVLINFLSVILNFYFQWLSPSLYCLDLETCSLRRVFTLQIIKRDILLLNFSSILFQTNHWICTTHMF